MFRFFRKVHYTLVKWPNTDREILYPTQSLPVLQWQGEWGMWHDVETVEEITFENDEVKRRYEEKLKDD